MKWSRIIVILLLLLAVAGRLLAADMLHQNLDVRIDPQNHRIEVTAELSLNQGSQQFPDILLSKRAIVEQVAVDGRALPYTFADGLLRISGSQLQPNLTLSYQVVFDDPVPGDFVGLEDPSYGITATIMPEGVYLSEASGWHPWVPGHEMTFAVTVTAPGQVFAVTSGRLMTHTREDAHTRVSWKTQPTRERLALAAGPYQVSQEQLADIQLMVFVTGQNNSLAAGYLESIREYLRLYQDLFGPYPYEKFAVVENFYPTGYGLAGWTLLGSSVVRLPFIRTTSLPHEIAHAWWGNAVDIDYDHGNWGEGLATYVADYYLKEISHPQEAIEYRRKLVRDYAALVTGGDDMPLIDFRSRMSKRDQAIGYGKAAMVFHMLRERIGDDAFWMGLKAVAREGRGKRYGWSDLRRHFEAVSGEDLQGYFSQWLERVGAPALRLSDIDVIKVGSNWQVSGNISQDQPVYELAVPLLLETAGREYRQVVGLYEQQDCFVFSVAERPLRLILDADNSLFRKLYPEELPATINDLRASTAQAVVVSTGHEGILDASRDLLRGLQWHQAPVFSEGDFLKKDNVDGDVLFLGMPQDQKLQPDQLGVSGRDFANPAIMVKNDEALFMVDKKNLRGPVVAYFLPGSVQAAQDTARRIPHYGRYSYLAFENGVNRTKGTWEPAESPLKIELEKDTGK